MNSTPECVKSTLEMSLKVIRLYAWLLDLYVLDFFTDNHWEKLPSTWRETFIHMDPQQLGNIVSKQSTNHLLPLSFLALMKTIEALTLPRKKYKLNDSINNKQSNEVNDLNTCKYHPKLKNLFLKHVKLKKRHEISLMADVVVHTARESGCDSVIDFGSGLGHLVRMLAYRDEMYAAGIECQTQLTEEARKLDLELEYTAKKCLSTDVAENFRRPFHFNVTLSNSQQLLELPLPKCMSNYGLIGLHPCGDLGPLLLKHFVESSHIKFLCVVGCCYMKLSCGEGGMYPMSNYVKGLENHLSYPSREIACHAIEVYCERLCKGDYEDLKIHAYRAALERILVDRDPKLRHAPVRSIKNSDTMTFEKYCVMALERLNIPLPTCPETWSRGEDDLRQWRRVVVVYTLRLALAPLVETVVLLDRMLYVMEQGLSCTIQPVFDPKLSPRNHIIIAKR